MDDFVNYLMVLISAVIMGVFGYLSHRISNLEKSKESLSNEIKNMSKSQLHDLANVRVKISEDYTTKNEFHRTISKLFDKIDETNARVESRINIIDNKLDERFQQLLDKLDKK